MVSLNWKYKSKTTIHAWTPIYVIDSQLTTCEENEIYRLSMKTLLKRTMALLCSSISWNLIQPFYPQKFFSQ